MIGSTAWLNPKQSRLLIIKGRDAISSHRKSERRDEITWGPNRVDTQKAGSNIDTYWNKNLDLIFNEMRSSWIIS